VWPEHDVVREDLERICAMACVPWQALHGSTVLVTGATGLIGAALVKALLWYGATQDTRINVLGQVRDPAKADRLFAAPLGAGAPLSFVHGNIETLGVVDEPVDYVIHGAAITASHDFVARPVETIRTALHGTERVLELARQKQVRSVAYLSSMEVYAAPDGSRRITESTFDSLDPMQVRSSYPESKRMAEALCAAYASEYGVPAKVLRLTQTFGPGVALDDARVFAQLARRAVDGHDIVLHTAGETERSYLYTADAVTRS
jgi:UDP-glucuronate decarboxylase